MVLGHESPITRVGRVMTVITHHPVVVELERVFIRFLTVDEDLTVLHLQLITLVSTDGALIYSNVLHVQLDALALGRNPNRTVVISCPACIPISWINLAGRCIGIQSDALHDIRPTFQALLGSGCQRHGTKLIQVAQLFRTDTIFLHHLFRNRLLQLHIIRILHVIRLLIGLSIEIYDMILDLKCLSGQTHAALYIVLAAVGRTSGNGSHLQALSVFAQISTTHGVNFLIQIVNQRIRHGREIRITIFLGIEHLSVVVCQAVILGLIRLFRTDGITGGIVEHHDIVQLHVTQALHSSIFPVGPFYIALALYHRQRMLCKRHGKRSLRDARTIRHLRHEEVIACEQ